ncbi:MAG TPA: ChaN family lipoprotein [Phycisphaerales bacterium]|nr:ChaN family lipoprotein [Phycisphaerales bacterium]
MRQYLTFGLLAAACTGGCATTGTPVSTTDAPPRSSSYVVEPLRHLQPTPAVLAATRVFNASGMPTDWGTVVAAATAAEVVVVAEQHGHRAGLTAAASLWRTVLETWWDDSPWNGIGPRPVATNPAALALEFFERDDQSRIDDYLAGLTTEEVFLRRTGKATAPDKDPWAGGYPPGHRDMLEASKAARVPVIAANAPRAYVRLARTGGYEALAGLTPEQQRLFALPRYAAAGDPPDNRYWRDFLSFMGSTPEKYAGSPREEREKIDGMFRAQSIWDATMADSVRIALARGHAPVFLVIGQFHADFAGDGGGGTVQALRAARPETKIVVISFQDADPSAPFRPEDKGRADFVVYCGEELRPAR